MKRRPVEISVSDHAVLRWLERAEGLDIAAIRAEIAAKVAGAAALGATYHRSGEMFVLRDGSAEGGVTQVAVTTVLWRDPRGRLKGPGHG